MQITIPLFNLRIGIPEKVLPVNVDVITARRKVSGWAGGYVSTSCGAGIPELFLQDAQAFWRVPIVFTRIGLGAVGEVGSVLVNTQTGELIGTSEEQVSEMYANAVAISQRLKEEGYVFQIRHAPNPEPTA